MRTKKYLRERRGLSVQIVVEHSKHAHNKKKPNDKLVRVNLTKE